MLSMVTLALMLTKRLSEGQRSPARLPTLLKDQNFTLAQKLWSPRRVHQSRMWCCSQADRWGDTACESHSMVRIEAHHLSPRGPSPTTELQTPERLGVLTAGTRAAICRPAKAGLDASRLLDCISAAFMMTDAVAGGRKRSQDGLLAQILCYLAIYCIRYSTVTMIRRAFALGNTMPKCRHCDSSNRLPHCAPKSISSFYETLRCCCKHLTIVIGHTLRSQNIALVTASCFGLPRAFSGVGMIRIKFLNGSPDLHVALEEGASIAALLEQVCSSSRKAPPPA